MTTQCGSERKSWRRLLATLAACAGLWWCAAVVPAWAGTCGDGILDVGEACDDGNTYTGDGCGATCVYEPGFCLEDLFGGSAVCTANDVQMALIGEIQQADGCDYPDDTAQVYLQAQLFATADERYDIGIFIALDGGTARTGVCHHNYLPPPLGTGDYDEGLPGIGNGGTMFHDAEETEDPNDSCGDLDQRVTNYYDLEDYGFADALQILTVACVDTDKDGFVDVGSCISWDNLKSRGTERNPSCTGVADTVPGTTSKCRCETLNTDIPFPGRILIDKVTVPANDPSSFDFSLSGGPHSVDLDFSLTAAQDPFGPGEHAGYFEVPKGGATFVASETVPDGWDLTAATCSDGSNPSAIHLDPGETVTCTFTNTRHARLVVIKHVINDNGGTAVAGDFTMNVAGDHPASFAGAESPGTTVDMGTGGAYSVTETGLPGYTVTYSADCTGTVAGGGEKTCTVTNDDVAPTLKLVKTVINDNGGTKAVADFPLFIDGNATTSGVAKTLAAGAHTASETTLAGYTPSAWGGDCAADGTITLLPGDNKTCTITNDDAPPALTLVKTVKNDNGGDKEVSDFALFVNGNGVTSGVKNTLQANVLYTATETQLPGYTASTWGGDCAADGTITLQPGDDKTCTITNDDIAPKLTLVKTVVNDDGGTLEVKDFPLFANDEPMTSGVAKTLTANTPYAARETTQKGYTPSAWGGDCAADGAITLQPGDDKTCTITNDDIAPKLTLIKHVVNDNGGSKVVADFPLFVNGNPVTSGTANTLKSNLLYTASETNQAGYTPSAWGGDCAAGGTITLQPGDDKTCTITNDDIAPKLTLVKNVVNDNGGTKTVADFPLFANGEPMTSGVAKAMTAGVLYTATETTVKGYAPSAWGGDCAANGTITLAPGDDKTCTITNDDVAPKLTLVKHVVNDNGGSKVVADFPLFVNGNPVTSGAANTLSANVLYTATETNQTGYTPSAWGGDCAANGTITLLPGDDKTCTITNDDVAPKLTLVKTVVNDDGGNKVVADFPLFVNGNPVTSGVASTLSANVLYTATETNQAGYTPSAWGGDCAANGTITLQPGDDKTCTITNDDVAPKLTLVKHVVNDNGGDKGVSDFPLFVNGTPVTSGVANTLSANVPYTASETTLTGYTPSAWGGDCAANGTITLQPGDDKTCTITNDDAPPTLTLVKTVINDNGGNLQVADFPLFVNGALVTSSVPNTLSANVLYTASETTQAGYLPSAWGGDCAATGTITLQPGDHKTCTITNDDVAPTLTLVKTVINDNGGKLEVKDFPLFVNGSPVTSGAVNALVANTLYTASESSQPGYAPTAWGGDCAADGTITLLPGDNKTCTITNDDTAPTLTLVKKVVNDNGGALQVSDFPLFVDGSPVLSGSPNTLLANAVYTASETTQSGYAPSAWGGDCAPDGTVTLLPGDNKTCTITNDDIGPTLTLVKTVINDNGGTLEVKDFPLFVNGLQVQSGVATGVSANTPYTASETTQSGYAASAWGGDCAADGAVTLLPGDNKTCTITNDDIAPTLTLIKKVVNDNGGDKTVADFALFIDGGPVASGAVNTLLAGTHNASETTLAGYAASSWGGDCAADGAVTLLPGDNKTCTITNDDIGPTLTLIKKVVNDNGGTLEVKDFPLFIGGDPATSGVAKGVFANQLYTASETPQLGYAASAWGGDCAADGTVTLLPGDNKTCTITNDDIAPTLTVTKVVVNNHPPDPGLFNLTIDSTVYATDVGNLGTTGAIAVSAGGHYAGELAGTGTDLQGYVVTIGGDCAADGSITLTLAQNATCTVTNTAKGGITVLKTSNQVVNPDRSINFRLTGPDGLDVTQNTYGDADGTLFGALLLVPGDYTLCENPVPAGWTSYWELDGVIVTPYNPNASNVPPQDLGVRCYDFTIDPGENLAFAIDNSYPGGEPRTIGYWKNWNRCTLGGQADVALKNGGPDEGFFLVEDLLPQTVGDLVVDDCSEAVAILDKSDIQTLKKKAADAAYDLAAQFLAARLNLAAGAETCQTVQDAVTAAQALLDAINFTGKGDYLGSKVKGTMLTKRNQAISLSATLNLYNNGLLCTP